MHRSRMSNRQRLLFNTDLNNNYYCINLNEINTFSNKDLFYKIFERNSKVILDIGFGNGDQLLQLAQHLPDYDFIGIEIYKKGIATLIDKIQTLQLPNIKIIYNEAFSAIENFFYDRSLFKVQIFFPDPWPKTKHHKRRLINHDFINLIKNKLIINGILHIATDSDDYAQQILKIITSFKEFYWLKDHYLERPMTKFEKIGRSLGNTIWDLVFVLKS